MRFSVRKKPFSVNTGSAKCRQSHIGTFFLTVIGTKADMESISQRRRSNVVEQKRKN